MSDRCTTYVRAGISSFRCTLEPGHGGEHEDHGLPGGPYRWSDGGNLVIRSASRVTWKEADEASRRREALIQGAVAAAERAEREALDLCHSLGAP